MLRSASRSVGERWAVWPVLLFLVLYALPLGWRPLLLPDEHRYAEIPREMLETGDWVVPRLNGLLYFEKPVLGYWLTMGSLAALGKTHFAVRLPGALAMGLTALLVFWLVYRAMGAERRRVAILATLLFLSCLYVAALGTIALLDTPLAFFLTGTLAAFFLATESPRSSRRERWLLALAGVFCGCAFLTKGFLAILLPGAVVGVYLLWQGRWRDLFRLPWLPGAVALLVALPWSILIHLRQPDFWPSFFWHEHVERFLGKVKEQHPEPWWYFLRATPLLLLPWTFFVPLAVDGCRSSAQPETRRLMRFCSVWVVLMYVFFSASSGKLVTYVLPAFPAIAILMAVGLAPMLEGPTPRRFRWGAAVGAAVLAAGAIALVVLLAGERGRATFTPLWTGHALAAALAAGALLLLLAALARLGERSLLLTAGALAPLLLVSQAALPRRVLESKAPEVLLASWRSRITPETMLLADADVVRAVTWVFERRDVVIVGSPGELEYGLASEPSANRWLEQPADVRALIEAHRGRVALILDATRYASWKPLLPEPASLEAQGPKGFVVATY